MAPFFFSFQPSSINFLVNIINTTLASFTVAFCDDLNTILSTFIFAFCISHFTFCIYWAVIMTQSPYWQSFIFSFFSLHFTECPLLRWTLILQILNSNDDPITILAISGQPQPIVEIYHPTVMHSWAISWITLSSITQSERNYSNGQKLKLRRKNSDKRQFFIQSLIFCCFDLFSSVWKVNGSLFAVQVRINTNFWIFDINIHIRHISRPFVNKSWNVFQGNIHSWFETVNNPCANISLQGKHFVFLRGPCWHFAD